MGLLSLSAELSDFKSEFKGQIVSKFDLGLLNAYKLILIEISMKIRMAKILRAINEYCVMLGEFLFMHIEPVRRAFCIKMR